mmetsp:Transcript_12484/g.31537  ORF Transcript_12484/g.31537 Transcript_12484/m.31537 type:complete len:174 (+) Transcript_12484:160-681(+)
MHSVFPSPRMANGSPVANAIRDAINRPSDSIPPYTSVIGATPDANATAGEASSTDPQNTAEGDLQERLDDAGTRKRARNSAADALTHAEIAAYFHLPRRAAATRLQICVTILKRRCRELGIRQWPFRKVRAIERLMAQPPHSRVEAERLETLRERRLELVGDPNIRLPDLLSK